MVSEVARSFIETAFSLGDFVTVRNQEFDRGLVVSGKLVPVGDDAYTLRLHFLVAPVRADHVYKTDEPIAVDPVDLTHMDDEEQERLMFIFNEDYRSTIDEEQVVLN